MKLDYELHGFFIQPLTEEYEESVGVYEEHFTDYNHGFGVIHEEFFGSVRMYYITITENPFAISERKAVEILPFFNEKY